MLQRTPIVCLIAIITCLWINPSLTQDAKFYVSSFDGNNANNGTSEKAAVEDIATAFKLAANNGNGGYVAIILAPGIYSNVNNLELDVPDNVISLSGTIETSAIETTNSKVNLNATALIYCSSAWFLRVNKRQNPFQFTLSNLYTIDCESVLKLKHSPYATISGIIAEYSQKASHPSYAISADGPSATQIILKNCAFDSSYNAWLRVFNATNILVELSNIRPTNETEPIQPFHKSTSFIDSKQLSISIKGSAIPSIDLFRSSGNKLMIQDSTIGQLRNNAFQFSEAISLINVEIQPFLLQFRSFSSPKEFLIQNSTIKSTGPLEINGKGCTDCSFKATDSSWQWGISIIDLPTSIITGCNFNSLLRVVNSNVTLQRQTVLSSGIEFQGGVLTIQHSIITLYKVAVPNIIHVLTNNVNNMPETSYINLINVTIIEPITAHTIPTPYSMITGGTSIDLKISIEQFILNNAIKFERLVDVRSASILIQVETKVSHSSFNNVSTNTPQLIATYNNGQTLLEHSNFTNVRAAGIGSIVINNDGIVQINDCNFSFNRQQVPAPAIPSKAFLCNAGL